MRSYETDKKMFKEYFIGHSQMMSVWICTATKAGRYSKTKKKKGKKDRKDGTTTTEN